MRKAAILFVLLPSIPARVSAQVPAPDFQRYELGAQFDITYLSGVGDWGGGLGARFHYNFDPHIALDSQLTYRQHNVAAFSCTIPLTGTVGQTAGLFGIRAGQRFESDGIFFHARAGFLHFGTNQGVTLLSKTTFPARRPTSARARLPSWASVLPSDSRIAA